MASPLPARAVDAMRAAVLILETYEATGYDAKRVVRAKRQLRRNWPELAGRLDLLAALTHNDPEPR